MKIETTLDGIKITDISGLDLDTTLDCGQCFRWRKNKDGIWCGVVKGIYREIRQEKDGITILGSNLNEFNDIWFDYFDLGRDYDILKKSFAECQMLKDACEFAPGIRVLHQEPWEAFISFIISQNNNIARIKGIIERLCNSFGESIPGTEMKSFPSPEALAVLTENDLINVGLGYRASYVKNAATEVLNGSIDLTELKSESTDNAREELLKIYGIGPKVADCVLLYGFGKADRCPADVWMKRVIKALGGKMPDCVFTFEGIAQQFLFHYARNFPEKFVFTDN